MIATATLPYARARLGRLGRGIVDLVLPPRCLACGEIVEDPDGLCGRCWSNMTFFAPPWCAICGLPFPHPVGNGAVCGDCARERRVWDRARSALRYDERSRGLVLALKHADRTHLAVAFGRWMRRAGGEVLENADFLVPVPLHWTRLFRRRYNQAALLANAIRSAGGPPPAFDCLRSEVLENADFLVPVPLHWTRLFRRRYNQAALLANAIRSAGGPPPAFDCLVRRRRTPSQGHLGVLARERNVHSAFAVRHPETVRGRRLVLVDDVMTTGATVDECARVLKRAGAASVGVLTLARALKVGA